MTDIEVLNEVEIIIKEIFYMRLKYGDPPGKDLETTILDELQYLRRKL